MNNKGLLPVAVVAEKSLATIFVHSRKVTFPV